MKITIRKANVKDSNTIISWNKQMAHETENILLNKKLATSGVRNFLKQKNYGFYLLALVDGELAGQLMITYEWSDWRNGVFWWIQSVYVDEKFRRKKIFTNLYKYVYREAKKNKNVCGIRLYVDKDNLTAQKTYTKLKMNLTHYKMFEVDFKINKNYE